MRRQEPWFLFCGDPCFAEQQLLEAIASCDNVAEQASLVQLMSRLGGWQSLERLLSTHSELLYHPDGRAALFHWRATQGHPNPWLALLPEGEQAGFLNAWQQRLKGETSPIQLQLSGGLGDQLESIALIAALPWRSRLQLVFPCGGEPALAPLLEQAEAGYPPWRFGQIDPTQPWLSWMAFQALMAADGTNPVPRSLFQRFRQSQPEALLVVCWRSKVDPRERLWAHLRSLPFHEIEAMYRWLLPWARQQGWLIADLTAYRSEERRALERLPDAERLETPALSSLADTATLAGRAQLVVSVDTALIHVAHGVAAPRWLLLHRHPDSRWHHRLQQDGSSDQRELKVLQQKVQEQWQQPLEQLRAELEN